MKCKVGVEKLREKIKKYLEAGSAKYLKITHFSFGAAATSTATSGEGSEDVGGPCTGSNTGEHAAEIRAIGCCSHMIAKTCLTPTEGRK